MSKVRLFFSALPRHFLSGLTLAVILWLTLAPEPFGNQSPELFPGADKVVHAIMFAGLSAMILLDCQRTSDWKLLRTTAAATAAALSAATGITVEFLQLWMDLGRSFEFADIVADTTGASLSATIYLLLQRYWSIPE